VDDEEGFVTALSKRLSIRDMKVVSAFTGQEALAKLDEEPDLDVVLLDVKMPGMDGIATLREIKKAHPITEVIMLTGHATVESAMEGMKLGAYDYLMKPCDVDELVPKSRWQKQEDARIRQKSWKLRARSSGKERVCKAQDLRNVSQMGTAHRALANHSCRASHVPQFSTAALYFRNVIVLRTVMIRRKTFLWRGLYC
jgi:DNA-binding NtrC family response regulator